MSRREYPVADYYEERERDFYSSGRRRGAREFAEFDEEVRTTRVPDFLREDYGHTSAGAMVRRSHHDAGSRDIDVEVRESRTAAPRPRTREVETEEVIIRKPARRQPSPSRSVPDLRSKKGSTEEKIEIDIKRDDARSVRSRPREVEREEIKVDIKRDDDARSTRSRPREVEKTDVEVDIRRGSDARSVRSARPPPPATRLDEEIIIRRGEGSRPPPPRSAKTEPPAPPPAPARSRRRGSDEDLDVDIRLGRDDERIRIREQSRGPPRERSMPAPNLVRRDHEEFIIRRRKPPSPSPSPPPPPVREERIVIRQRERSPSPEPPPPPPKPETPPPPVLAPIIRPPIHQEIHQEIITHHRHIDHGVERAKSASPSPSPPPPAPAPEEKVDTLEIDIRRKDGSHGHEEEEIEIRQTRGRRDSSPSPVRARSVEVPRRRYYDDELEAEADFYNRKALERGYNGEAVNGATRDWGLVDIPPGTERVRMEGAGGGGQEISWQRYNGNRRSKFFSGDREFETGYGLPAPAPAPAPPPILSEDRRLGPVRTRPADMWTEVTKDLVIKEAIETMGYEYEETEQFFYVMEYLKYEDVLQLVEISDDIRRARRRRLREIEWERRALEDSHADREYYEREVIIDRRTRG